MIVTIRFSAYFAAFLGGDGGEVEFSPGMTLGETINLFLEEHPEARAVLKEKKLIIDGKLRGLFSLNGGVAHLSTELNDGDEIAVRQAIIGG